MIDKINFPALVINNSSIDKIDYRYLVADRRYISKSYRGVLIVDRLGNCFETESIVQSGGISIFYSIKLVGILVKVSPILKKPVYKLSMLELKNKLTEIIERNPRKFSALSDSQTLIKELNECSTYDDVLNLF